MPATTSPSHQNFLLLPFLYNVSKPHKYGIQLVVKKLILGRLELIGDVPLVLQNCPDPIIKILLQCYRK
jgi:hypothetical protein